MVLLTTYTPLTTFDDASAAPGSASFSLRDAVIAANADAGKGTDTIVLGSGTYTLTIPNIPGAQENASKAGDLDVTSTAHALVIVGKGSTGPSATVLDQTDLDRVLQALPGTRVTLEDLAIEGGVATDDGAASASPGSTAAEGGGVLDQGSSLTLSNVLFSGDAAQGGHGVTAATSAAAVGQVGAGGGLFVAGGTASLTQVSFEGDSASGGTGGAVTGVEATDGFNGKAAQPGGVGGGGLGGGLFVTGGAAVTASKLTITSDMATGGAGASGVVPPASDGNVNSAGRGGAGGVGAGGGLYISSGGLALTNSVISLNSTVGGQGGVGASNLAQTYTSSSTSFITEDRSGGAGGKGGVGNGGGLYTTGASVTLTNVQVEDNATIGGPGRCGRLRHRRRPDAVECGCICVRGARRHGRAGLGRRHLHRWRERDLDPIRPSGRMRHKAPRAAPPGGPRGATMIEQARTARSVGPTAAVCSPGRPRST